MEVYMKILFSFILVSCCVPVLHNLSAEEEPVCKKCEMIREANKHKVNPYIYYEDYLKAHPEEQNKPNTPVPEEEK
jgi:hypothetical protein